MLTQKQQEDFTRRWTEAQPSVTGYVRALVKDPGLASDIVQETAVVLCRKFGEYDRSRSFLSWALGFARFKVLGHQRDNQRSFLTYDSELLERFTEVWERQVSESSPRRMAALEECLKNVSASCREMLNMRYHQSLNSKEIASRLGRKSGAVRVALQRIREQLRDCIDVRLKKEEGLG